MKIITISKSKERIVSHVIIGEPTSGTYADSILLRRYYKNKERAYDVEHNGWKITLFHHFNFLLKQSVENNNNLVCAFCGEEHLIIYPSGVKQGPKTTVATVDHFYPREYYDDRLDEGNMVVCCLKCNNIKGDKIYGLETLKYVAQEKIERIKELFLNIPKGKIA